MNEPEKAEATLEQGLNLAQQSGDNESAQKFSAAVKSIR
jgi:hypothetical protein